MTSTVPRQIDPSTEGPPDTSVAALTEPPSEAALKKGIIHTRVTRPVAWALTALFLAIIFAVPVAQTITEKRRGGRVQALDLYHEAPTKAALHAYEEELEKASAPRAWVQPRLQVLLSQWLSFGNAKVVLGRDGWRPNGWLFYEPGVSYLTGRGFLDPDTLHLRREAVLDEGEPEVHPDPRPAILQFHRELADRGIRLVLVPVPDKAMLQPEQLAGGRVSLAGPVPVPNNPDFARLVRELRERGVDVFDPTPPQLSPGDPPRFLVQDTHWTPQWMQSVAGDLAAHLRAHASLGTRRAPALRTEAAEVARVGDLVDMLQLPAGQTLYRPQTITIQQVRDRTSGLWQPRRDADVLLLGDSFTNIYSAPEMGWGEAAGLAEHLSLALGRDVDLIARNDEGAHATREILARELAKGRDRLSGKKVLVWQFAVRELAVGDWKPVELKLGTPPPKRFVVPEAGREMTVTGTVEQRSPVPRPGSVPYTDHIMSVHLADLEGPGGPVPGGEAVVYLLAMRDKTWTDAARLRVGQRVTVRLRNWNDVAGRFGRIQRTELADESLLLEDPAWGEVIRP